MRSPGHHTEGVGTSVEPDLKSYRAAIEDLIGELAAHTEPAHPEPADHTKAEQVILDRLDAREFGAVLSATPSGHAGVVRDLLFELRQRRPGAGGCHSDLTGLVRIFLSSQIDAMWWGRTRPYQTDADVVGSRDLVDLDSLRRRHPMSFRYRRQPATLPGRLSRAVQRRCWPDRTPRTAGLRFSHTRPEVVALLNRISADLAQVAPDGTPPPWVTSMARSVTHQRRLRSLGYPAILPSAHCVGYAIDVEMAWFRQFRADRALAYLLLERQDSGDANIIDEGQVWHVCVNPAATARLRAEFSEYTEHGGNEASPGV